MNKSVERLARGIAETQLNIFLDIQRKDPTLSGKELYAKVLSFRPGYDTKRIDDILRQADESLQRRGQSDNKVTFRDVVHALALDEYLDSLPSGQTLRFGDPSPFIIARIVEDTIPQNY